MNKFNECFKWYVLRILFSLVIWFLASTSNQIVAMDVEMSLRTTWQPPCLLVDWLDLPHELPKEVVRGWRWAVYVSLHIAAPLPLKLGPIRPPKLHTFFALCASASSFPATTHTLGLPVFPAPAMSYDREDGSRRRVPAWFEMKTWRKLGGRGSTHGCDSNVPECVEGTLTTRGMP